MNENSIRITDGKVSGDSVFFKTADDLLKKEIKRLDSFTDLLDKDFARKKENIADYKCAKIRSAAVSLIHSVLYNNNNFRKLKNLESTHYLLPPFDEIFRTGTEYQTAYKSAPLPEKPDCSLYFMLLTFADRELADYEAKLQNATDWEKIELKERIGGIQFAKECIGEAWNKRKDMTE